MNFEKIKEELKLLILEISPQFSMEDIDLDTNLMTDLVFDSIMTMELIVRIEDHFNIEIDGDDLIVENIGVFGELYKLIIGDE